MFKTLALMAGLAVAMIAQQANAQVLPLETNNNRGYGYNGYVYGKSTTAAEGWQRGRAAWLRGYGEYLRSRAEAAYWWELTRQQNILNRELYIQKRWNIKDEYAKRRAAYHADRRAKREAYLANKAARREAYLASKKK